MHVRGSNLCWFVDPKKMRLANLVLQKPVPWRARSGTHFQPSWADRKSWFELRWGLGIANLTLGADGLTTAGLGVAAKSLEMLKCGYSHGEECVLHSKNLYLWCWLLLKFAVLKFANQQSEKRICGLESDTDVILCRSLEPQQGLISNTSLPSQTSNHLKP
jgi:hypothetical protein